MFHYKGGSSRANPNRRELKMSEAYKDYFPKAYMAQHEILVAGRVGFSLEHLMQQGDRLNNLQPQRQGKTSYREAEGAQLVSLPAEPEFIAKSLAKFLSWVTHFIRFCRTRGVQPQDFQPTNVGYDETRNTWVVIDAGSFRFPDTAQPTGRLRTLQDIANTISGGLRAGTKDKPWRENFSALVVEHLRENAEESYGPTSTGCELGSADRIMSVLMGPAHRSHYLSHAPTDLPRVTVGGHGPRRMPSKVMGVVREWFVAPDY
jgi:hypothetical protein